MAYTAEIIYGPAAFGSWYELEDKDSAYQDSWFDMNSSNRKIANTYILPKSGTITEVGFSIVEIFGSPPDYSASLQTAPYTPTGTLYGGSAKTDFTIPDTPGWVWVTLDTPATAVEGERVGIVIEASATAPDGSNYISIRNSWIGEQNNQYHMVYAGYWGTGSHSGHGPMALKYSDGEVVGFPALNFQAQATVVGVDDSPDEVGARFAVPFDCVINKVKVANGIPLYLYPSYSDNFGISSTITLYGPSDNVLMSYYLEPGLATRNVFEVPFDDVSLSVGVTYRLTQKPSTSKGIRIGAVQLIDAAYRYVLPDGMNFAWTERTDGGAWSDDDTIVPFVAIVTKSIG